jgi:hypothetical protein
MGAGRFGVALGDFLGLLFLGCCSCATACHRFEQLSFSSQVGLRGPRANELTCHSEA